MRRVLRASARVRYRVSQVAVGLRPGITPAEIAEIRALLSSEQMMLFARMEGRDRRHSMDMVHWLRRAHRAEGLAPPTDLLLRCCLLHDIGKGRLNLIDRVIFVLLGPLDGWRERIAAPNAGGFRRRQWALLHHARIGSVQLAAVGAPPRMIEMVARHLDPDVGDDEELRWLQAADEAC